jgi:hypothetical protein
LLSSSVVPATSVGSAAAGAWAMRHGGRSSSSDGSRGVAAATPRRCRRQRLTTHRGSCLLRQRPWRPQPAAWRRTWT